MVRIAWVLLVVGCGSAPPEPSGGEDMDYAALPFATEVVDFQPGPGAGFGDSRLPDIVLGPPMGGGEYSGGIDVLSLGVGGEITLSFGPRECIDGPGVDFIVFENPFRLRGTGGKIFQELAEVSVSSDGVEWSTFPCEPVEMDEEPLGCAGWSPVLIRGLEESTPLDPSQSGGDPFDLEDLGLDAIRFVRIRDLSEEGEAPTAGFDLDAVGLVHFQ
ncbi:MAG TPA: cell surface protein [Myxococcales bacterium]|nr:cell surface protein [Myxococcales bacterium]HBU48067.1 cell surface protein [Myxococcales bacterium]